MSRNYDDYKEDITQDIKKCLEEMTCQPILFVGSGVSRRYLGAPSWEELLKEMAKNCPRIDKGFAYYKQNVQQKNGKNLMIEIGTIFAELYRDWAWNEGRNEFPEELFTEDKPFEIYLKYKISEYLNSLLTDPFKSEVSLELMEEIKYLKRIRPHAIITTNYDLFLESIFTGYEPIIGQQILKTNFMIYGEILKIHGCVSNPISMVLTTEDYKDFNRRKKYLSSKLLTYFVEHPLLFIGYSAEDPNIKSILSDVDEIISSQNEIIPNIYILEWDPNLDHSNYPQREKIIPIDSKKSIRIKNITVSSFKWVFEAFGNLCNIHVDTKLLRALVARTYDFVRTDIPRNQIELNYKTLERAVNAKDEFVTLFGLTNVDDPSAFNAKYPYNLTMVGEKLGLYNKRGTGGSCYKVNELIEQIKKDKDVDIKASDNRYHFKVKIGKESTVNKYSDEAISLLTKVKDKVDYSLDIN